MSIMTYAMYVYTYIFSVFQNRCRQPSVTLINRFVYDCISAATHDMLAVYYFTNNAVKCVTAGDDVVRDAITA